MSQHYVPVQGSSKRSETCEAGALEVKNRSRDPLDFRLKLCLHWRRKQDPGRPGELRV